MQKNSKRFHFLGTMFYLLGQQIFLSYSKKERFVLFEDLGILKHRDQQLILTIYVRRATAEIMSKVILVQRKIINSIFINKGTRKFNMLLKKDLRFLNSFLLKKCWLVR